MLFDSHFACVKELDCVCYGTVDLGEYGFFLYMVNATHTDLGACCTSSQISATFLAKCATDLSGAFNLEQTMSSYLDFIKQHICEQHSVEALFVHIDEKNQILDITNFGMPQLSVEIDFGNTKIIDSNNAPITAESSKPRIDTLDFSTVTKITMNYMNESIVFVHRLPRLIKQIPIKVEATFEGIELASEQIMEYINSHDIGIKESVELQMALGELLLNALEHGILGMTCETKRNLIEEGEYEEKLAELLASEDIKNRAIEVYINEHEHKDNVLFSVEIKDDGEGFDVSSYINKFYFADVGLVNGRGIVMSYDASDGIYYNQKGNEVLMIKHLIKERNED